MNTITQRRQNWLSVSQLVFHKITVLALTLAQVQAQHCAMFPTALHYASWSIGKTKLSVQSLKAEQACWTHVLLAALLQNTRS